MMKLPLMMAAAALSALMPAADAANLQERGDPLDSARWREMHQRLLGGLPYVFDPRVRVIAPLDAEHPRQVPVTVDATALGRVREVLVFADFNPLAPILRFFPAGAVAYLGFRIKLRQSTPVRAAVRTADGLWHVGGSWVNTAGDGYAVAPEAAARPEGQAPLNEVSARQWREGEFAGRLRLRIAHPMDSGLVAGLPAFHLQEILLADAGDRPLMRIETFAPVSENPVFTVRQTMAGRVRASGRDNHGNTFDTWIES